MICGECHGTMVLGKCSNCGWIDEAFEPEPEVAELTAAEVEQRERRRIGYHVTFRIQDAIGRPTFVVVLFGIHPLVWAAGAGREKYGTTVLDWREFNDVDGSIYEAVTKQTGFSWEEAEPQKEE